MSERTNEDRKPIHSMQVDRYHEFIDQSENLAGTSVRSVGRPAPGAPVLTIEVDEMTVFTDKAIVPEQSNPVAQTGDSEKRESA